MAEPESGEPELKPGLYTKKGNPFPADRIPPDEVTRISKETGIDFVYDGDKNTLTPERYVVVPKKKP